MSFTIAMNATILNTGQQRQTQHCIVVTRSEVAADYLTVADIGPSQWPLPVTLHCKSILVGAFARCDSPGVEVFKLRWEPPSEINTSQTFLPAFGELVLDGSTNTISLSGQYATENHGVRLGGRYPFEIRAEYMKWDGELLERNVT